jgi:drug/metabolite transporter (DMT)-like permease
MFKGIALVFLGACSFGILSTFVKLAYREGFTLGDVTGTQVLFGFVILWLIVIIRQLTGSKGTASTLSEKIKLAAMGTSTGLVSIFYYKCVQMVPASVAILLLMQFTWMSLVFDAFLKRRMPDMVQIATVIVVLIGTALAGRLFADTLPDFELEGILYGLLAALCYTVFLMVNGSAGNAMHPTTKSAIILTGACLLVLSIFPPEFLWNGALANGLWKWGLILAIFGTVIPPLFFAYGIPRTGLSLSAILSAAELPVAVLMSSLVLQENVGLVQWLGVALILLAIIFSNLNSRQKKKKEQRVLVTI